MKKLLSIVLVFVLALSVCSIAYAEGGKYFGGYDDAIDATVQTVLQSLHATLGARLRS